VARFDLHRPKGSAAWLLNVQAAVLDHLRTRVVVPLLPPDEVPTRMTGLHPAFEGHRLLMATQLIAAVPRRELGRAVGNLAPHRDDITRALGLLLTGF
jgi:toxin CcdB